MFLSFVVQVGYSYLHSTIYGNVLYTTAAREAVEATSKRWTTTHTHTVIFISEPSTETYHMILGTAARWVGVVCMFVCIIISGE